MSKINRIIEQIISYVLGLVFGCVGGLMLWSLRLSYLKSQNLYVILAITSLIGLIVSIVLNEFKKERLLKTNNSVRNEAIALITHEMRTGLTSTGWAIQLILQKYGDQISPEDKSNLESVLDSIHTTIMHSVNLLDISVLDLNKLSVSLEWMPLSKVQEVLGEITKEYAIGADKKKIQLVSEIELDGNRQVEVDILRLKIILENLLENAIQYTIGENKMIQIKINNTNKNLEITVKDNGIGIPQTEQEKIFGEFYRASNARAKLHSGSGIGLYACKQYVKAHRGTISFKSKENEGTTFYISIPLKTEENINEFMEKI